MSSRSILSWLKPSGQQPAPSPRGRQPVARKPRRETTLALEPLEPRLVPWTYGADSGVASAVVVDAYGDVVTGGNPGGTFSAVKLSGPAGDVLWRTDLRGSRGSGIVHAITLSRSVRAPGAAPARTIPPGTARTPARPARLLSARCPGATAGRCPPRAARSGRKVAPGCGTAGPCPRRYRRRRSPRRARGPYAGRPGRTPGRGSTRRS